MRKQNFLLVERILVSRRRKLEQCLPQMWRVGQFVKDCSSPGDDLNSQREGEKVQGPSPTMKKEVSSHVHCWKSVNIKAILGPYSG